MKIIQKILRSLYMLILILGSLDYLISVLIRDNESFNERVQNYLGIIILITIAIIVLDIFIYIREADEYKEKIKLIEELTSKEKIE